MDLEKNAIEIIKTYQGEEPYQLGYSGGKDSDVILHIARKCGARYEAIHNLTTVDAPETVYHVKKQPDVKIIKPELNMWQLIVKNGMPPTRLARYCCKELKEKGGIGKKLITGVRWEESESRREKQGYIAWNESEAGFYFNVLLEDEGYEEECMYDYADGMEVIGNIYENPELLSQLN